MGSDGEDYFLRVLYSLAASMVGADGKIEPAEIQVAERIGAQVIDGFDPVDFREMCENFSGLPDSATIAGLLKDGLDEQHKRTVLEYLEAIANADGHIDPAEETLLGVIRKSIGVGEAV